jgi:RNA polymerase sigma-70 factor (ECF subfamily)
MSRSRSPSLATVAGVARPSSEALPSLDRESWVERLRSDGAIRDEAIAALHGVLLRATRFEVRRRGAAMHVRGGDQEDLAQQCADDALLAVLSRLDDYRGESRFTTWAYKFGLYEAAVRMRRLAWQHREIPLEPEWWPMLADPGATPQHEVEMRDLIAALRDAIERDLTPHQREVVVALALNEVPIDVLGERLNTTRGALYKTLHDGRRKLRAAIAAQGLGLDERDGSRADG